MKFISGLSNCHLPGLYSLVLSERENETVGMRRVFYASHWCDMDKVWDGADFLLKPHNHRQDITLTLLFGKADNVTVKFMHGIHRVWCYRFSSALLNGDFSLDRMNYEDAHLKPEPITEKGTYLHWSVVHTVRADRDSAWLVKEGMTAPEGMERLWSTDHDLKLSNRGLYRPMGRDELDNMARYFTERGVK